MHAQDWIQLARYGHLPVGNLGGDWLLDIADAHFARCLRDCGHLLWITDPSIPDVASRGDDDAMEDLLLSADPAPLEVHLSRSSHAPSFMGHEPRSASTACAQVLKMH